MNNIRTVAAGRDHSLALRSTGTVVAWGDNTLGQTNIPPGLNDVVAIAAGGFHNLALRNNGRVASWGYNFYGQTNVPADVTSASAVAAGGAFSMALLSNGVVTAWGDNFYGQTNVPPEATNVVSIAAGFAHALALRSDGTVISWGDTSLGQDVPPTDLTNAAAIAAGYAHSLALTSNRMVVAWGTNDSGQLNVPLALARVDAIAAGFAHSIALTNDRAVFVTEPQDIVTNAGSNITFTAEASGPPVLTYNWYFNGVKFFDSGPSLTRLNVSSNHAGAYFITASNVGGYATSRVAMLTVLGEAPPLFSITTQPQSRSVPWHTNVTFSVVCTGVPPFAYQWRFGQTNLLDATNSSQLSPISRCRLLAVTGWSSATCRASSPVRLRSSP